jgi:hypothetical protein
MPFQQGNNAKDVAIIAMAKAGPVFTGIITSPNPLLVA